MPPPDHFRIPRPADHPAIDALVTLAFGGPAEACLVRALRDEGVMEAEFVMANDAGAIIGHLALSRLVAPAGWLALAPVAVHPDWQGRRIGSRFVAGVARLMAIKGQSVVVLGKPSFYARAGFSLPRAAALAAPYPNDHLLILRPGEDVPAEALIYPAAFDGL